MSIHSSFYRFALSSDVAADGNGQSSNAAGYHVTSDAGNLLMALSTDRAYHITQLHASIESVSDTALVSLVGLDSNTSDATPTRLTKQYSLATGAALLTPDDGTNIDFNPPIKINAAAYAYLSVHLDVNDSDALVAAAYNGFTSHG